MKNWARGTSREEWLQQRLEAYLSITRTTRDPFWKKLYFDFFQQYPWNLRDDYEPPGSTCTNTQKVAAPCPTFDSGEDLRSGAWLAFEPDINDRLGLELKEKAIQFKKQVWPLISSKHTTSTISISAITGLVQAPWEDKTPTAPRDCQCQ